MPRERSLNRDKAYEIYKQHGGIITNREIATLLDEDEKVIAVWKSRDKWKVVQQSKESCTTKKKGGQPGNKNAEGNKGGAAPRQNKNAVKTGEFETVFFDTLEPDEMRLINMVQPDKEQLLLQEIQLLTVRERRMLKRIKSLRSLEELPEFAEDEENKPPSGMSIVKYSTGFDKGKLTDLKEYESILGQIQAIEDALTRVQARRQRAIEALHKFGYDDAHLELEAMKFELEIVKQDGSGDDQKDDGFMDAMNATASEIWGDADV
ncbi:phage terminase small subunit [Diplocloster modestus]|uniref:Terminase n=1 Tax=Diplocloster modestus TaxID=2850322 RepID=A0ABS6K0Q6_9FIRM|nr:phage terminase small subunit [Diplocloster modestus]MBU9724427.1 terminase [Diplocloster modestus]